MGMFAGRTLIVKGLDLFLRSQYLLEKNVDSYAYYKLFDVIRLHSMPSYPGCKLKGT
jgi:hypothetical protein